MPWLETRAMDQKVRFIAACQEGSAPMTVLCERFGISRQTGYKYLGRYRDEGLGGLVERSRAPHRHGLAMAENIAEAILDLRRARPYWGPKKLKAVLASRTQAASWPACSTIGDLLRRHGLVEARQRRRRATPSELPLTAALGPNDVWCADFKGWFRTGDGKRCDPLTVTDAYSRYLLHCGLLARESFAAAKPAFEAVFKEYGLPRVILSDNGTPFAGTGAGGLARLPVWFLKLGIRPERIEPGQPQQNGRHERMHRTMKQEVASPSADTYRDQENRLAAFRDDYNRHRPHEALGQRPPATSYQSSPRPFPATLREPRYGPDAAVRKVRSNGEIRWDGDTIFVSEVLIGEPVGILETEAGHRLVRFFDVDLGIIDPTTRRPRRLCVGRAPRKDAKVSAM